MKNAKKTRDARKVLKRLIGNDPELQRMVQEERENADLAQQLCDARIRAGLTQAQLAAKVGTKQPVIARLEDADYDGHSVRMLRRIARALDLEVKVQFVKRVRATA